MSTAVSIPGRVRGQWIDQWQVEDGRFWTATGARIARRNLIFSIFSEHIGFSVWSLWSVLVLFLGPAYHVDTAGKFLLTALPTAVGSVLRVPYTLAVASTASPASWTTATPMLPPPAFRPSAQPFSRCG